MGAIAIHATARRKLGWGRFPDGAEVISVYDPADGKWGYAVNVTVSQRSDWGYAPFGRAAQHLPPRLLRGCRILPSLPALRLSAWERGGRGTRPAWGSPV